MKGDNLALGDRTVHGAANATAHCEQRADDTNASLCSSQLDGQRLVTPLVWLLHVCRAEKQGHQQAAVVVAHACCKVHQGRAKGLGIRGQPTLNQVTHLGVHFFSCVTSLCYRRGEQRLAQG
eukprot:6307862-Prymnesium_polylepis.1